MMGDDLIHLMIFIGLANGMASQAPRESPTLTKPDTSAVTAAPAQPSARRAGSRPTAQRSGDGLEPR